MNGFSFLLLSSLLLFGCIDNSRTLKNSHKSGFKIKYDPQLKISTEDSLFLKNTQDRNGYPQLTDSSNSFFQLYNDTLNFYSTGWLPGSYYLAIKVVNDSAQLKVEFFDNHKKYVYQPTSLLITLNRESFKPNDYLIGEIYLKCVGSFNDGRQLIYDTVICEGKIRSKVRDRDFTFEKLSVENNRNEFYSLLKQRPDTIKKLNLFGCALTDLPPELIFFKNLEELKLDGNELSKSQFTNLEKLKKLRLLDLNDCNLSKFPNSILALSKLEILSIWNNQISTIPEGLYNITSLKELTIGNNKLKYLSPKISNLKNLKSLETSATEIRRYPDEMTKLKYLIEIYPSDTMEYIPKSLIKYVWGCDTILNK